MRVPSRDSTCCVSATAAQPILPSMLGRAAGALVLLAVVVAPAHGAVRPAQLANHCFSVESRGRLFVKPTGLGRYLLYDRRRKLLADGGRRLDVPDASSEWVFSRRAH